MEKRQIECDYTKLVAAIPHCIPYAVHWQWQENSAARAWRDRWTDWFTDELFGIAVPGVSVIKSRLARLDCDVERLEDETDRLANFVRIADDEQLHKAVDEAAYRRNGFLAEWYRYRAEVLAAAAEGASLIVDCHSFPSDLAPDVDICIGFNEDASRPEERTLELVARIFRTAGYLVAFNHPYANALAPAGYVGHSLMIEVNKRTYMNEHTLEKSDGFVRLQTVIRRVYEELLRVGASACRSRKSPAESWREGSDLPRQFGERSATGCFVVKWWLRRMNMKLDVGVECVGCGACVADCPVGVLAMSEGRPDVSADKAERCMNCQHCLTVCPVGALSLNGVSATDCVSAADLRLPSAEQMRSLMMMRRSVRQFAQEDLPRERISALLETLKCVPTGCNARNLTFKVVASRTKLDELRTRMAEMLIARKDELPDFLKGPVASVIKNPKVDPFFRHAPHLLIVQGDPSVGVTPQVDCDAACAYFDLLAQGSGLGVTWCGFLHIIIDAVPEVADIFGIPRGAPFYAMMFGAPAVRYARTVCRRDGARIEVIE